MRVVFLDRDGVINVNKDGGYITSMKEFVLLPGVVEAIRTLNEHGVEVIIVSNQAGVSKGLVSWKVLKDIEHILQKTLCQVSARLLAAYYCPHAPEAYCGCRKPESGLLLKAAQDFDIDLKEAFMVGDAMIDIEAGKRVGCYSILVKTGRGLSQLRDQQTWTLRPDNIVADLAASVQVILRRVQPGGSL